MTFVLVCQEGGERGRGVEEKEVEALGVQFVLHDLNIYRTQSSLSICLPGEAGLALRVWSSEHRLGSVELVEDGILCLQCHRCKSSLIQYAHVALLKYYWVWTTDAVLLTLGRG